MRDKGNRHVAVGGCFDILHAGHIDLLYRAAKFGDMLDVYINSDQSVTKLKGAGRPILTQKDRLEILSALRMVRFVWVFNEDTPCKIISERRPDIWIKGGDYHIEDLPEAEVVYSYGGEVVILPFRVDISTSKIIEQIKSTIE